MKIVALTIVAALFLLAFSAGASDEAKMNSGNASQKNIVDTAIAAGNFKTLTEAVTAAGLVETLSSPGPFTVFAPTDEAFAKVPKGVLEALMANKTLLTAVLTYHVVPGAVMSSDLKDGMSVKTVEGSDVKIAISPAGVMVNNAKVIQPDIKASNGVIHAIDSVILPPAAAKVVAAVGSAAAVAGKVEAAAKKVEVATKKVDETAKKAESATQNSMPGFESIFAIAGLLSVAFIAFRRRD
ncbi:MAG: fasciclin domain-containing protein [Methanothrix sp.]|nr:fasciclin domain-containing protein [Methanothrix sp.]